MKNVALISALFYTGISLVAALIFFLAALAGDYTAVERFGGSAWVFLLSMIGLMPVVLPAVKKRMPL